MGELAEVLLEDGALGEVQVMLLSLFLVLNSCLEVYDSQFFSAIWVL